MGRPGNVIQRVVVEDCEIVKASDTSRFLRFGVQFTLVPTRKTWSALVPAVPRLWPQSL